MSPLMLNTSDSTSARTEEHRIKTSSQNDSGGIELPLEQQPLLHEGTTRPSAALSLSQCLMKAPSSSGKVLIPSLSSPSEVLYYASVSMLPVFAIATILFGEAGSLGEALLPICQHSSAVGFGAQLASIAWIETALAGTLVWCTECNGSLTTSIVGVLKGVVAVVLGLIFMTGPSSGVSLMNLAGIGMVLLGGSWYSSLKCLDQKLRH
jgi:hypothetical protein